MAAHLFHSGGPDESRVDTRLPGNPAIRQPSKEPGSEALRPHLTMGMPLKLSGALCLKNVTENKDFRTLRGGRIVRIRGRK